MKRTIVIGDIHGCVDEFVELTEECNLNEDDRVVLLGDLIDRGPDPAGVVAFAKDIWAESVMGNHEEKALRWRKHEQRRKHEPNRYKNPMKSISEARLAQWAKIPDEHWDWIATWPLYLHINDEWSACHAGCMPDVPIEKQYPNELMRLRYIDKTRNKMASLNEAGLAPENSVHWTTVWNGPRNIVYGHYTYMDGVAKTTKTLGLDTGCVHGGTLTAAIFTEGQPGYQLVSVQAKKVYVERRPWNESVD